jgi:3-phenylpropionate/trans-cinnamate dioxygenase ferredoxin component
VSHVEQWTTVANVGDVPEGGLVAASLLGVEIVVTNVAGDYWAVLGVCPHAGCSLATDGEVEESTIICLCHGSAFDLHTGEVVRPPAEEAIPTYSVRVSGNAIQVARSAG